MDNKTILGVLMEHVSKKEIQFEAFYGVLPIEFQNSSNNLITEDLAFVISKFWPDGYQFFDHSNEWVMSCLNNANRNQIIRKEKIEFISPYFESKLEPYTA